jgi:hypothetical protein
LADFQEELPRMRLDHDVAFPPPAVVEIVGIGGGQCNQLQSFLPNRAMGGADRLRIASGDGVNRSWPISHNQNSTHPV